MQIYVIGLPSSSRMTRGVNNIVGEQTLSFFFLPPNAVPAQHMTHHTVFTEDLISTWIEWKRKNEVDYVRLRPHPAEFELYYDI